MRVRPCLGLARPRSIVPNVNTKGPRSWFVWAPATLPTRTRARSLREFQNRPASTQLVRVEQDWQALIVRFGAAPRLPPPHRVDPRRNGGDRPMLPVQPAKSPHTLEIAERQTRNLRPPPLACQARTKPSYCWNPVQAPVVAPVSQPHARPAPSGRNVPFGVGTGSRSRPKRANSRRAPMLTEASSKPSDR